MTREDAQSSDNGVKAGRFAPSSLAGSESGAMSLLVTREGLGALPASRVAQPSLPHGTDLGRAQPGAQGPLQGDTQRKCHPRRAWRDGELEEIEGSATRMNRSHFGIVCSSWSNKLKVHKAA